MIFEIKNTEIESRIQLKIDCNFLQRLSSLFGKQRRNSNNDVPKVPSRYTKILFRICIFIYIGALLLVVIVYTYTKKKKIGILQYIPGFTQNRK